MYQWSIGRLEKKLSCTQFDTLIEQRGCWTSGGRTVANSHSAMCNIEVSMTHFHGRDKNGSDKKHSESLCLTFFFFFKMGSSSSSSCQRTSSSLLRSTESCPTDLHCFFVFCEIFYFVFLHTAWLTGECACPVATNAVCWCGKQSALTQCCASVPWHSSLLFFQWKVPKKSAFQHFLMNQSSVPTAAVFNRVASMDHSSRNINAMTYFLARVLGFSSSCFSPFEF